MDDSLNLDKHGDDELDDSCLVVGTINVLGVNGFGEAVTQEFVPFYETPIKTID